MTKYLLIAGFVYSYTFWYEFHLNKKYSSSITLPFDLSCCDVSVMAILAFSRWRIIASVADRTGNTMLSLQLWSSWETSDDRHHYWSGHHKSLCDHPVCLASGSVAHCAGWHGTCSGLQSEFCSTYTHVHKWLPEINKQKFTHPQAASRGSDRRGSGRGRVCSLL